ncbi:MAG: hypothetical protein CM15mP44_8020 [Candidatus Neomarinimicrobiota bacterium]|nr:MAG: hypothetical protein CM15mP44_8020 [Candidatus Neomarinimicrobiota bacterium]
MTDNKEKLIAELVNKGLDGDMDAVNACEDRMIRAKAKAMIVKVGKGTADVHLCRYPMLLLLLLPALLILVHFLKRICFLI